MFQIILMINYILGLNFNRMPGTLVPEMSSPYKTLHDSYVPNRRVRVACQAFVKLFSRILSVDTTEVCSNYCSYLCWNPFFLSSFLINITLGCVSVLSGLKTACVYSCSCGMFDCFGCTALLFYIGQVHRGRAFPKWQALPRNKNRSK